jgi:hypothetical protein
MHVDRLEKAGKFPRRFYLGAGRVVWKESEILAWLAAKRWSDGASDRALRRDSAPVHTARMKLTIEPTEHFFMVGAVMVRAWQGVDATGQKVTAFVAMVQTENAAAPPGLLIEIPAPDAAAARRWAETILRRTP